jgi:transcriptional regulator with XRE-family HTH domain
MPKSMHTDAYASFRELLLALRNEQGVSQLARRLGREQTFISQIERGVRRMDVVEFYAITRARGTDPEAAFSRLVRGLPAMVEI